MYRHILIPTDGSELSDTAVRQGVQLARSLNARVTILTVTVTFHTFTADPFMASRTAETYRVDATTEAERALSVGAAAATAAGVPCETVRVERDHPYEAIIDAAAERGCDLIFMASHGRKGMAALVLGSETTKVLTHTKIPVLVCR